MDKIELIRQREDIIQNHFNDSFHKDFPIVIPYITTREPLTFSNILQYPIVNRHEITYEDWQQYLKIKEYNNDFDELLK